jgi:hypothetical protein
MDDRIICNLLDQIDSLNAEITELTVDATYVFVGCYTNKHGHIKGDELGDQVYTFKLNTDGSLTRGGPNPKAVDPSYVNVHPNKKFLYAAAEVSTPVTHCVPPTLTTVTASDRRRWHPGVCDRCRRRADSAEREAHRRGAHVLHSRLAGRSLRRRRQLQRWLRGLLRDRRRR